MKIGIYGGTFNPPHLGHLAAAKTAFSVLGLDKLIWIPASLPPHKELPADTPGPEHRLAMAQRMADAMLIPKRVSVSAVELERPGKSYTSDTLEELRRAYPEAELWLLMGSDMFLTLHQWHDPAAILRLAGVCAFGRTRQDGDALFLPQRERLAREYDARVAAITLPDLVEISSTRLREMLAAGEGGAYLLPSVYGYILMNGLYGVRADLHHLELPELRACSFSVMNGAKRQPHVLGVEEEAVRLARRWGADETLARRAGILHDCTKYWTLEEHLSTCQKYGVELDGLERQAVKLLHSKTGACIARHVFGEDEEVCQAIYWHTTGKADMALLDKVLYLADYIEPTRAFDGVEELRALAYTDLDGALRMGMEMTIREMKEKGSPVHPNTQAALDYLRAAVR